MVVIRPVSPDDHANWLDLWNGYLTFYESELDAATTEATFARITSSGSGLYAAIAWDDEGRAVGLVQWLTHPATWTMTNYCYLEDLFVSTDARGAGTGATLIEHVRSWAKEHGSTKVYWLTAETNTVARGLYDRVASRSGLIQYQIQL